MPNRTACSILEDMRNADKTKNYGHLDGLIEEMQCVANRMEATLQAVEIAKQTEAKGRADAIKNQLLVQAGLTPLEKAQIDRDTAIGVARELAKITMPTTMVIGGNGGPNAQALDPFTAIGLNQMLDMSSKFAKTAK